MLEAGEPTDTESGGSITTVTGYSTRTSSGSFSLTTPNAGLAGVSGSFHLTTGTSSAGDAGSMTFLTGDATQGKAGDILLQVGNGNTGPGGAIVVQAGETTDDQAVGGAVAITAGPGTNTDGSDGGDGGSIVINGATANNLKNIDVVIPTGTLNIITGVSGSGKSTLIMDILARAAAQVLHDSRKPAAPHRELQGLESFEALGVIDQQPIGRTPTSNAATYTGIWSPIRGLFAKTPEAKTRGWRPGRFSFNVADGRSDACEGRGGVLVEMHFLSDVWVTCDECKGKRFNDETLSVRFKGATIADILQLEVTEACSFFENIPKVNFNDLQYTWAIDTCSAEQKQAIDDSSLSERGSTFLEVVMEVQMSYTCSLTQTIMSYTESAKFTDQ